MKICIVTTAHLCNNPRVVKEADALHAVGHDVRVISFDRWPEFARLDRELMATRSWKWKPVMIGPHARRDRWLAAGVAERLAKAWYARGLRGALARDLALSKYYPFLVAAAVDEAADLVIGHHAQALPAAAAAARRLGARLGFDFEDLHSEDFAHQHTQAIEQTLTADVERHYVARCDVLTASSEPIAREIAARYGVPVPQTVLNVFPASDRDGVNPPPSVRGSGTPSLYWFSQVIGSHRGLEEVLAAVALLPFPVQVHLRGTLDPTFGTALAALIEHHGLTGSVHAWPRVAPSELVQAAAEHDVGLAVEQPVSRNRDLCVTNKLFVYMLAGLAIAATDTVGQRSILGTIPDAGFLYRPGDVHGLAAGLERILGSPDRLAAAKTAALEAARSRYSWEHERVHLVRHLTTAVATNQASSTLAGAVRHTETALT